MDFPKRVARPGSVRWVSTLSGLAITLSLLAGPAAAQLTPDLIYSENFDDEVAFNTTPEIDVFGAGGMSPFYSGNGILNAFGPGSISLCDSIESGCPTRDAAAAFGSNILGSEVAEVLAVLNDTTLFPAGLSGYSDSLEVIGDFDGLEVSASGIFAVDPGVVIAELNGALVHAQIDLVASTGPFDLFSLCEQTQGDPTGSTCSAVPLSAADSGLVTSGTAFTITVVLDRSTPATPLATARLVVSGGGSYALGPNFVPKTSGAEMNYFGQFLNIRNFELGFNYICDSVESGCGLDGTPDTAGVRFDSIVVNGVLPVVPPPPALDADLDGIPDTIDNCIDVFNFNQDNPDGDLFGTACDNCPNVANDDQTDSDMDSRGDVCDNDAGAAEELVVLDSDPVRPGEDFRVSLTFKNPSDGAILTPQPTCLNTTLELRNSSDELLKSRHLIAPPVNLALKKDGGDLIKLEAGESFTTICNVADHFAPEELSSGASGAAEVYEITAHYANDLRNPNCLPEQPGFMPDPDECPELTEATPAFVGVVSSSVTGEITVEGDPILPERTINGSCTMVPDEWFPEWVGIENKEVTATISGLPVTELVPDEANIEFEGIVPPNSTSLNGTVELKFDRMAAMLALGSVTPGDVRFPDVAGLLTGPVGDAFKSACRIEIGLAIAVEIDIKPGSEENKVNLGSNGNVPVAIFSTAQFDATTIDPTSVTLANANLKVKGKGTLIYSHDDINGDGLPDMLVHIETQGLELTASAESADLAGRTLGGTPIFGTDHIQVKE